MKKSVASLLAVGGIIGSGANSIHAASFDTFGPWASVGSSLGTSLDMPAPAGFVEFSATFSASGTFRAADGTPNSSSESYTVSYALVQVTLSSANGILTPDPVTLSFNDVSVVVDLVTPATGSPSEWPDFNFSMTPVTKSLSVPYAGAGSLEDFTVEWTFLSALSVTGGKGVASFVSNPSLEGSLNAVPEPAEVALVAGAGLLMLAGVRAWRRR